MFTLNILAAEIMARRHPSNKIFMVIYRTAKVSAVYRPLSPIADHELIAFSHHLPVAFGQHRQPPGMHQIVLGKAHRHSKEGDDHTYKSGVHVERKSWTGRLTGQETDFISL